MTLKVVYAGGTWDLLHAGHINFLEMAKAHGDVLIVGVLDDASMRRYKHPPVIPYEDRVRMVKALRIVDKVVVHYMEDREATEADMVLGWRQPCAAAKGKVPWCPPLAHYIKLFGISLIVHGDDHVPQEYVGCGVPLVQVPYSREDSTSAIIQRVKELKR